METPPAPSAAINATDRPMTAYVPMPLRQEIAQTLGFDPFTRLPLDECIAHARTLNIDQMLGLMLYLLAHTQRNSFVVLKTTQRLETHALAGELDAMAGEADHG